MFAPRREQQRASLPSILSWPILLFPNFLYVVQLLGLAVHDGIAMFRTHDDLILITFNVCGRTTTMSVMPIALRRGDM